MARAIFIFLSGFALVAATLAWLMLSMPDPRQIKGCMTTEMFNVSLCDKNSSYAHIGQISNYTKDVIVISEDSSFYQHHGFDWFEIRNSMEKNWSEFSYARGGSTISQQLAKNVFLSSEKSLLRKLREAYLTFQIEQMLTKPKILERYLNVVEFGKNIYGVKAAAHHYFGKSPANLNLLESAYLAYLLPNPKMYSRVFYKGALTDFSRFRILDLCYKMYRYHRITEDQYLAAKEYIGQFPWRGLSDSQIARLNGTGGSNQPFEDIAPENTISDSDSKIAAPIPSDKMMEEINNLSEDDQPFGESEPTLETVAPKELDGAASPVESVTPPTSRPSNSDKSENTFDN